MLPNMPENAVILVNHATHNNKQKDKVLTRANKIKDNRNWLH